MLTLSSAPTADTGLRRRTLSQQIQVGAVSLTFVVIVLALIVSLIYLTHANRVATRGYVIKRLEIEKTQLVTENEIWRQQVSEAKSLRAVKESPVVQSMVGVRDPAYIRTELAVAKK